MVEGNNRKKLAEEEVRKTTVVGKESIEVMGKEGRGTIYRFRGGRSREEKVARKRKKRGMV